jgi:hypothetical protein
MLKYGFPQMQTDKGKVDKYYALMEQIKKLRRDEKYPEMLGACQLSWPLIESAIDWRKGNQPGRQGIRRFSVPSIEIACPFLAAYGGIKALTELRDLVHRSPDLSHYKLKVDEAFIMCWVANRICWKAKTLNGVLQKDLELYLNYKNVKIISRVVQHLEKIGRVKREKAGTTYRITC